MEGTEIIPGRPLPVRPVSPERLPPAPPGKNRRGYAAEGVMMPEYQKTAIETAQLRHFTAAQGKPPTPTQRSHIETLTQKIVDLSAMIDILVPPGRNKSLAFTALEEVQMRANRAIFDPMVSAPVDHYAGPWD